MCFLWMSLYCVCTLHGAWRFTNIVFTWCLVLVPDSLQLDLELITFETIVKCGSHNDSINPLDSW